MNSLKAPLFAVFLVGLFIWAGEVVARVSGGSVGPLGEGVTVENGEQLFWGPGKCSTCHSVGPRGSSVRGPNLGGADGRIEIALRAAERAEERSAELGNAMRPTEYLVESIADPSAYVVEGFKNEMPKVYEPPISLVPDQVASVILYLQSIGGVPDPSLIALPPEIREAARRGTGVVEWEPYLDGDSLRGRELFFDQEGSAACAKCHTVGDQGGNVGPELTSVAGTRTVKFIVNSIVQPSQDIASGYETYLIQTTDGRLLDGVLRRETEDSLWLASADGEVLALAQSEVARRREQEVSLMPGNLSDVLTVTELHDLLAFLRTLR